MFSVSAVDLCPVRITEADADGAEDLRHWLVDRLFVILASRS